MARTKGSVNITPEARAFVKRVERMLRKADPDTGSLERLACRLLTHPANQALETKFFAHEGQVTDEREVINWAARLKATEIAANVWRVLMNYKHGMPVQPQQIAGADGEALKVIVEHIGTKDKTSAETD